MRSRFGMLARALSAVSLVLLLAGGLVGWPAEATAQGLGVLKTELESGVEARVLSALARIAEAPDPAAAPLVDALLERGGSEAVMIRSIEVSGVLAQPASSRWLSRYVNHRIVGVRRAAVLALTKTRGPEAVPALRRALKSGDAGVRSLAATGLGTLGAEDAVPDLFLALDRGVHESAASIGQLCRDAACSEYIGRLGKLPLSVMLSGCNSLLRRPGSEISDAVKLDAIARLAALRTRAVHEFLAKLLEQWPQGGSAAVKKALEQAVQTTSGSAS